MVLGEVIGPIINTMDIGLIMARVPTISVGITHSDIITATIRIMGSGITMDGIMDIKGGDIMPTDTIIEAAAADYAAGVDWFDGKHIARSTRLRAIRFFGVTGSAAEGDMSVELFIGDKRIGEFYNTATAIIPQANTDLIPVGRSVLCPAGTAIHCITKTASGTNPAGVTLVVDEL